MFFSFKCPLNSLISFRSIGFCVKARQENNEKCFINICTSDAIPLAEDITADQLTEILSSETPSTYKIPMSITELRITPDKSGQNSIVCDVAIHSKFFQKINLVTIFRDFLMTIIFEALNTKYNLKVNQESWLILKNRKCMGSLISHRIQNRDVKNVYKTYQNPNADHKQMINELSENDYGVNKKSFITEITTAQQNKIKKRPSEVKAIVSPKLPKYKLYKCNALNDNSVIGEFFMPEVTNCDEIRIEIGIDRVLLEVKRFNYSFDAFFPVNVDPNKSSAQFNASSHVRYTMTKQLPKETSE